MSRAAGLAHSLLLLSGAAALVYETSWSRQVGLVIGNTAEAAAVVLAAFFAGMAAGQYLGGLLASRVTPLRGYGVAELIAAAWACVVPALLDRGDSPAWCFVVLLPGTVALGATFPFAAEHLATQRGVTLGYAANTAGGLLGVGAASALLLVLVGVRASGYLAAATSVLCGVMACVAARRTTEIASRAEGERGSWAWLALAALSGFGTLGLEVLYTRLFSLVFHNSTYTFGAVVAVFLLALAGGAALAAVLAKRFPPRSLATASSSLGAIAVLVSLIVFVRVTGLRYFAVGDTFASYLAAALGLVALVVLPPVTLLGLALPAAFQTASGGRSIGRLAAVNTLGAAAGALTAGFVVLPRTGLWAAFVLHAGLFTVAGIATLLYARRWALTAGLVLFAAVVSALVLVRPADSPGVTVVHRWDSAYGWIDVVRDEKTGALRVRQNLHYSYGSTLTADAQQRLGRLPLALHPRPQEVLYLGLGTGLTAAPAVSDPDVEEAVVVELIPEVVEAARLLGDANAGVVDHPRVDVKIDDARHFLRRTERRFDVITSDLFVPWESRAGYLYTVEFYEAARRRLKPGGLFCQWLPLYQLGASDFELIADSAASVFPNLTLWWGQMLGSHAILALVGSDEPLAQPARSEAYWEAQTDPELQKPSDLPGFYLGRWPRRDAQRNTDERPWLEFTAPVSHKAGRTLHGATLRDYFDRVLVGLPADGVTYGGAPADVRRRRATQRLSLSGGAD